MEGPRGVGTESNSNRDDYHTPSRPHPARRGFHDVFSLIASKAGRALQDEFATLLLDLGVQSRPFETERHRGFSED